MARKNDNKSRDLSRNLCNKDLGSLPHRQGATDFLFDLKWSLLVNHHQIGPSVSTSNRPTPVHAAKYKPLPSKRRRVSPARTGAHSSTTGRASIERSKGNVAMSAWPPQASYPCGNFCRLYCSSCGQRISRLYFHTQSTRQTLCAAWLLPSI